jgi:hypothetical protein
MISIYTASGLIQFTLFKALRQTTMQFILITKLFATKKELNGEKNIIDELYSDRMYCSGMKLKRIRLLLQTSYFENFNLSHSS